MPVFTPTLASGGTPMPSTYQLLSIDIQREIDRIPHAEIRVQDGNASTRTFDVSDTSFFQPGATVDISLRYEGGSDVLVFSGLVVRHGVEASRAGSVLVVGLKDPAVSLSGTRRSAVFANMDDSEILRTLLSGTAVQLGTVEGPTLKHRNMVQYHCTTWDFIVSRADALGLAVVVEDGTLSLRERAVSGSARQTFEYGIHEIFEFDLEADASHQYAAIESITWDPKAQALTAASQAKSVTLSPGNLKADELARAVGNSSHALNASVPLIDNELQAWADAHMARSRLALLRGRLSVPGVTTLKLLDVIELAGVGQRFSGTALITGLRHRIDRAGWRTDIQVGGPPEGFVQRHAVQEPAAAGLLPAVRGLQIGVVADFEKDPDGELRVKVLLPSIDMQKTSAVWARLATPDAGGLRGFYFRPEPNDEVVVGFLNEDPRCPIILGSLFGSKNAPPASMGTPDADNMKRGIVSKKGLSVGFVDAEKPSLLIETPKQNRLLLDEDSGGICLSDQNGNSIKLDKNGITITSAKALKIEASKDVAITGSKVDIK